MTIAKCRLVHPLRLNVAGAVRHLLRLAPDERCSCRIRRRRTEARLVDGRMAHVLDDALAACHHQYVQHNELMPLAFKSFFYSAARGKLISVPRQIEMTDLAGKVNPGPELYVLNQHLIRQGKQCGRMKDSLLIKGQGFVLHG